MRTVRKEERRAASCFPSFAYVALFLLSLSFSGCDDSTFMNDEQITSAQKVEMSSHMSRAIPSFPGTAAFVPEITNSYLAFERGKTFIYEGETDEGVVTITVEVTGENKTVMGVSTTVVREQEFVDGELIEDTFDWFAQDVDGNVWYFGEDSRTIEDGMVVSTGGSWEAGVDGALPGIIMLANPLNGMKYRQEFFEGEAEDHAHVINTDKHVEIELGEFDGSLQTMEYTPLEPGSREFKFYHPGTGLILELERGGTRIELIEIE